MKETTIMHACMLHVSKVCTIFRNNVGSAWQGTTTRFNDGSIMITRPRRVQYGLYTGSSDLIGWMPVTIRPEHVGKKIAVFLAIEVKGASTAVTDEQINFLQKVAADGGIAVLARGEADVAGLLIAASEGKEIWGQIHGEMPKPRRQRKQPGDNRGE